MTHYFAPSSRSNRPVCAPAGGVEAEVGPAAAVEAAAARGAGDQAELDEIGLDDVLDRVARFAEARGEGFDPDRAAVVEVGDHREVAAVHRVEPEAVDLEPAQGAVGGGGVDAVVARGMGEIAHAAEQAAGDARRAAAAAGDFVRAVLGERGIEQPGGAADDLLELGDGVEIEPDRDAEAVAQRGGEQALRGSSRRRG